MFLSKRRLAGLDTANGSYTYYGDKILQQRDFNLKNTAGGSINKTEKSLACLGDVVVSQAWGRFISAMHRHQIVVETTNLEAKKLLENQILNTRKKAIFDSLAIARITGVAAVELIWQFMTDAIVIADVYPIDSSRIQYKLEDNYRCVPMISQGTNESAEIPPYQMVIHRHYQARIDNPYGVGIGGLLIELIEWRNALLDLWLILSKKYVEPVKIGKVPDTASDEEVDAFFDQLNKLRNSSTFVLPVGFEIDFQTASASEFQSILLPLLEYCDQKINGLIIGESIVGKDISNANQHRDGVAAEITEDMAKSMAQEICDTLNETVVQWLLANNFDEPVEAKLVVVDSEDVDAGLERLKMLKDLGLQIDQDWLAEKYNVKRAPIKKTLGNI